MNFVESFRIYHVTRSRLEILSNKTHNVLILQRLRLVFYDFLGHLRAILNSPITAINQRRASWFQRSRKSIVKFDPRFENDGHVRGSLRNGTRVTKFNFFILLLTSIYRRCSTLFLVLRRIFLKKRKKKKKKIKCTTPA